ncbi:MAG: transcriptional regulator [Alphaproteobacteria bacterium]|nr:MAG: transcriptional regulator [Alphaproteobacteria bacterium]
MAEAVRALDPAPVFAALGDPIGLSRLMTLSDGQARSIKMLSADTRLTRQAVTKHLRVLEDVGLVASAKQGRESRFGCRPEPLDTAHDYLDRVGRQWHEALGRLKAFVEGS